MGGCNFNIGIMEQQDREMLIRIDERQQVLIGSLTQHVKDSKEFHFEYINKLNDHNNRLIKLEEKTKPGIVRFFAAIGGLFMGK